MGLYQIFKKQGGFSLVYSWIKNGVLFYAIGQILIGGFSKKNLELLRCGVELKLYKKLRKKYLPLLKNIDWENNTAIKLSSKYVWVC